MAGGAADIDPERLQPSAALLAAQIALGAAIESRAVAASEQDATTLDLLVRLSLAPGQRLRAIDLCHQLKLSASHVSRRLDRAEAAGLITREPDPEDRRAKRVVLSADGGDVVRRFAPGLHRVLDQCIHEVLDPAEITRLIDYLERIEAAASRAAGTDP